MLNLHPDSILVQKYRHAQKIASRAAVRGAKWETDPTFLASLFTKGNIFDLLPSDDAVKTLKTVIFPGENAYLQ